MNATLSASDPQLAEIEACIPMVSRIAASYEARPALQEELVQESVLALWRAYDRFQGKASFKTYAGRIAHNICVSHVRRESRAKFVDLDDAGEAPVEGPAAVHERADAKARLVAAVRELPLNYRQVLTLHLEGFSDEEVAEALELSVGNVAVRLTRARGKLKQLLGGDVR